MLLCLSSSHRTATFDLLERLSVGAPDATRSLVESASYLTGAVVLATCNRFEAYLDIDEPLVGVDSSSVASAFIFEMAEASGVSAAELRDAIVMHQGDDVAGHLFSVSSGLESVVIGEDEISGQVSRALDVARSEGTTSRDLERLFQRATHVSRGVKNATSLGGAERSLVRLALEMTSTRVADWSQTSVLVIGTGRYAATTVGSLRALGAADLRVFSPSGRAAAFAARQGMRAETDLAVALADADVVIACTADAVIGVEAFGARARARRIVIDLGLPRNIDPAVAGLDGVELLDLETIKLHAPYVDVHAHDDARALIHDAAAEFTAEGIAAPVIAALRQHVLALVDDEIERARSRGAGDETEAALRHQAGVFLHEPTLRIRQLAAEGRIDEARAALRLTYGIEVGPTRSAEGLATA